MRQKYYVCMDYGLDETGKRVKKYKTYPTLAQARRGLRDFQTEQDTHQTVAPRSMTLDQWLEYWMEEVIQPNRAATTIYGYRKIIDNHLSDALGSVPIQKLTPQHLQQYYSMLMRDKGLSANTVRRHHDLLSCALHMALRQDIILRCPTERVEPPRVIPHEARFYTPAELKRLFGLVEGHWLELIVKLAGSLGLRREDRYLMLGEPDVPAAPGDRVVWRESGYEVRTAHPIYLGERLSHWWAVLAPWGKEET